MTCEKFSLLDRAKRNTHTLNNLKNLKPNHTFWLNKIILSRSLCLRLCSITVKAGKRVTPSYCCAVFCLRLACSSTGSRTRVRYWFPSFALSPSLWLSRSFLYLQLSLHLCLGGSHGTQNEGDGEKEHADWGRPSSRVFLNCYSQTHPWG